jgi:DNA primase small subunit
MSSFLDYYKNEFPANEVFEFFNRAWQPTPFAPDQREWGVETTDGRFKRWKSCSTASDLKKLVGEEGVGKLNVGAVFETPVRVRWKQSSLQSMVPTQREFVIDIDLDDYASSGIVVDKNDMEGNDLHWPLVAVGILLCMEVLKSSFGFSQFMLVYSGRRGGHLWVCDQRACELNNEARAAIIKFLTPGDKTNEHGRKAFKYLLDYPTFGGCMNPLEDTAMARDSIFIKFIWKFWKRYAIKPRGLENGLGLLDDRHSRERFIRMADLKFSEEQVDSVMRSGSGIDCFKRILDLIGKQPEHLKKWTILRMCETICTMLWPRPDVAVSTHMNHTLKAPYSVHPGTGRISVPVFMTNPIQFNPATDAPLAGATMPDSFGQNIAEFKRKVDSFAGKNGEEGGTSESSRESKDADAKATAPEEAAGESTSTSTAAGTGKKRKARA